MRVNYGFGMGIQRTGHAFQSTDMAGNDSYLSGAGGLSMEVRLLGLKT